MARDRLKGPEERASGPVGCNLVFVGLLLVILAVFIAAAFLRSPSGAPEPADTGVIPTDPAGR